MKTVLHTCSEHSLTTYCGVPTNDTGDNPVPHRVAWVGRGRSNEVYRGGWLLQSHKDSAFEACTACEATYPLALLSELDI